MSIDRRDIYASQEPKETRLWDRLTIRGKRVALAAGAVVLAAAAASTAFAVTNAVTSKPTPGCELLTPQYMPNGKPFSILGLSYLIAGEGNALAVENSIDSVNPSAISNLPLTAGETVIAIPQADCTTVHKNFPGFWSPLLQPHTQQG